MGFRSGAYAKIWEVEPKGDTCTTIRISVSRKSKQSGEYEQDFSGFVSCIGTAAAQKALKLTKGSTIKLGDCDVSTRYDRERKVTYTNYKLFSFEESDGKSGSKPDLTDPQPEVDGGDLGEKDLPF